MALAVRHTQGDFTQMKKLMSIMLALALTIGVAGVTLAQDAPKKEDTKKKKGGKKKGDAKTDSKDAKAPKGKGKKGKDAEPATK
jgi:hypothetical protein